MCLKIDTFVSKISIPLHTKSNIRKERWTKCYYPLHRVPFIYTKINKLLFKAQCKLLPTTSGSFHLHDELNEGTEPEYGLVITHYIGFLSFTLIPIDSKNTYSECYYPLHRVPFIYTKIGMMMVTVVLMVITHYIGFLSFTQNTAKRLTQIL